MLLSSACLSPSPKNSSHTVFPNNIKNGSLFVFIQRDVEVPKERRESFANFYKSSRTILVELTMARSLKTTPGKINFYVNFVECQ